MTAKLFVSAIAKFMLGAVLLGALLFLPAGTLAWPQAWLLMCILFIPMFLAGLVMMAKNPGLLRSRLNAKEKRGEQSLVVKLSGLMFLVGFILAGLSFRFGWLMLPRWVSILGAVLFLISYALYAEVLRENTWLSRTIEVQENQQVVSTGLYGVVRHPMYAVTLTLFLSMPLVLGSGWCFIVFLAYPFIIARRLLDEERFLAAELPGYAEYMQKVKWRLLPFIW
ncbi:MAG: isoprenylcysteine carboxylmethyltransferase family protein [Clostridia bacterium]|nr:isoprenylcysteine carboxylmethyltransferase family protein [Clostridia bacterium]